MRSSQFEHRSGYSPYPLVQDSSELGLVTTRISSDLGSTVAHHRTERRSHRATLFLHGAAGSWTTWSALLQAARHSGAEWVEPVLFDLPGWGDGTLDDSPDATTIDVVCELINATALRLGYTEWDLVGHSMGGFIAMHLAAREPDKVRSVVTVSGTTWSLIESADQPLRRFRSLPDFVMLWRIMALLAALGRCGTALVRVLDAARLLRPAASPLFAHPFRIGGSVIGALAREVRPRSFLAAVEIAKGYDAETEWAGITCPITAIMGDHDALVRDTDLDRLRELLPESQTTTIADCGHFAHIERPLDVVKIIVSEQR